MRWGEIKKRYLLLLCVIMLYNFTETEAVSFIPVTFIGHTSAKSIIEEVSAQDFSENIGGNDLSIVHPHQSNCYESTANGSWVTLINMESATDPTYKELLEFIKSDNTDEIEYNLRSFVCADFAQAVHNNAEKAGIKAAWVSIEFEDRKYGHACNAFNTTDRGLVFVDCTGPESYKPGNWDSIVEIKIGEEYKPEELFKSGSDYESMGIVKSCKVYW
jgi:hypothetical protein